MAQDPRKAAEAAPASRVTEHVDTVTRPLKKARLLRLGVPIVSGVLVAGIGVLMLTNTLVRTPQYFDWGGSPRG